MEFKTIILEKKNGRATITLNRPQVLNCLSTEMWLEIEEAIDDIRRDSAVKVMVITGKGKVGTI